MTKISEAQTYGLTIRESATDGSDFANAPTDYRRLFLGEDGQLHVKNSAGAVTDIGGTAGVAAFVGAKAFNSGTQAVGSASETLLALDSEEYDTDGFHDTSTNNSRMTIPAGLAGYYLLLGYTLFAGDADGGRYLWFRKGASTRIVGMNLSLAGTATIGTGVGIQAIAYLAEADYVSIVSYHVAGNSINLGGTDENSTSFSIARLGT
jgi:hypothetical protein